VGTLVGLSRAEASHPDTVHENKKSVGFCHGCCDVDLVLPAWVGVAFHGTWTALLAAEVIIIGLPDDCQGRQLATSSVLWLLVSFALTTLLQCVVAGISMRGNDSAVFRAGIACRQAGIMYSC
jgi:hypothetical protein